MEKEVIIESENGLHARPAGLFVKEAKRFESKVDVAAKGKTVNGKSLMSLLTLGLEKGDKVQVLTDGPDAEPALDALVQFLSIKTH